MHEVEVRSLETIADTIRSLHQIRSETQEQCADGLRIAEQVLSEAENEFHVSSQMLNACRAVEALKLAKKLEVEARMAQAAAEEAAAVASGNPIAIAAATARVAAIVPELAEAVEEYRKAVEHRERIEHRCGLAQKCVEIAQEMCGTLRLRFRFSEASVVEKTSKGMGRLQLAHDDLTRYLARISPDARREIAGWDSWKPKENEPVRPDEVRDRLNASKNVTNGILAYLYATDMNFRAAVDRHSHNLKVPGMESGTLIQIKRNIVGRLCEELVIRTFLPMGTSIETQYREDFPDGTYTKVDMLLRGLKQPLILGKGEGMGAREGGSLGIEVKAGQKEYLYGQISHLEKQAQGHRNCDISCTVCSRDIKDLSPDREAELRERVREAGSPMMGMLPYKEELDRECIAFVKAKAEENV